MATSCNSINEKYFLESNIQRQMEMLQLLVDKDEMLTNSENDTKPKGEPEFEYHGYNCSFDKVSSKTNKSDEKAACAAGVTGLGETVIIGVDDAAGLAGTACFDGATGLGGTTGSDGAAGLAGTFDSNGAAGLAGAVDLDNAEGLAGAAYCEGATGFSGDSDSDGAAGFSNAAGATGASYAADTDYSDLENDPECIKLMEQIESSNRNPVVRIFRLLKSMHMYLKDEFPSTQPNFFPSEYVYDWPEKYTMPKTLSIKYQLQFAARKLNKFNIRLRRILKRNENLDYMKFKECNDSLTSLEGLADELNSIKDLELRHDDYEFKTDAMKALASTVEMLIQRINDQIREAHLLITVFNWEMDLEHRQSQTMINERQKTLDYAMEMIAKSRDEELKEQDPEYQAALKAKYKLPSRFNLDDLSERVAKYDDLWEEMLANPGRFHKNYNIPPEGLIPKTKNKSETPKKKSAPVPNPQFYEHDDQEFINQMRFENDQFPEEIPNINNFKECIANNDDLWAEMIANPVMFCKKYNIPSESILSNIENMYEMFKKKSGKEQPTAQFPNDQGFINQMRFPNDKLPKELPKLDDLNERIAKYDELWNEITPNPEMFPSGSLLPKREKLCASINQMSSENVKLPKEIPVNRVHPLNNTERPLKPTDRFG